MAIPAGIIVLWPSTNASIPAGWLRETALDTYYIQAPTAGADADLVTVRGNASHNHTSPAHTPIQDSHTHTISDGGNDGSSLVAGNGTPNAQMAPSTHTHSDSTSSSATATNNSISITVNNTTNDLTYTEVIFIKSDGTPTVIPNGAYAFIVSDTFPTGWSRVTGNTYLKGPVGGGNAGGTGGSTSHSHTSPAHTHTQNGHTHAASTSGPVDLSIARKTAAGSTYSRATHTHQISGVSTIATNQSVTTTINSTTAEPVYKKLNTIANSNVSGDLPDTIVALWGGTNAGIPINWNRVTAMDGNFHKSANANGESGIATGGSLTHTHTASNCQPIQNSHGHSWNGTASSANTGLTGAGTNISSDGHLHSWFDDGSTIATNQATTVSIDVSASEAHYPQYKQVIFIQYSAPLASNVSLLRLLSVGF